MLIEVGKLQEHAESAEPEPSPGIVLRAERLAKRFGGKTVLSDVSLELRAGEVALLQGANGSGKTTLLNILTGYLEPDHGRLWLSAPCSSGPGREWSFPRSRWWAVRRSPFAPEALAPVVVRTWQELRLFTLSLYENLAVADQARCGESLWDATLRPWCVRQEEARRRGHAHEVLTALGLDDRSSSSADRISLGQAKRIAIARALAPGPKVLFLDEPLAGLDTAGVLQVVDYLREVLAARQLSMVIVEHPLSAAPLRDLVTTTWRLEHGRCRRGAVPTGPTGDRVPSLAGDTAADPGVVVAAPHTLGASARLTILRRTEDAEVLLDVRDLMASWGTRRLFDGQEGASVSISLQRGDLAVLCAPNGWGKSTLLKALAGLHPIDNGVVRLGGRLVRPGAPPWERRRLGLGLLRPDSDSLFETLTVRENLRLSGQTPDAELSSLADRRVRTLSGGERQALALRLVSAATDVAVWLLDEPFTGLDPAAVERAWRRLLPVLDHAAILIAVPRDGVAALTSLAEAGLV